MDFKSKKYLGKEEKMDKKVQATMSTEIALDLVKASESIKSMTQLVNSSTQAWKAQEAQLKSAGDSLGAAKAKYDGLGASIQAQESKIEALKRKQSELKGDTQQTAEQYLKYQQQIDQATAKLASMEAQQSKAKQSMEYYSSGLAGLQTDYKKMNELSNSYVKRLEAEGNKRQAAQEKAKNLKEATENLSKQYKSQVDELEKIKNKVGATSEAYHKQKIRVNETAAALASSKAKTKDAREEMERLNPTIWTRMRDSVKKFNNEAQKTNKIGSHVKDFVTGNLIANGITNITSKVVGLAKEGYAAAEAASKTAERWQNLGFAEEEIKRINSTVKDLKYNTNLSGGAVGDLILKFHGITHNVDEAAELAKGVGSLSDQLKLSQERAEAFAGGLGKIEASGTVTATSLNKLEKQAPGLVQALQKASGLSEKAFSDLLNSGKMTSKQFNDILKSAGKSYEENAKKYGNTAEGAKKRITLAWADTKKALMKPLVNVASTGFNQLANVLQNPAIQSGVTKIGEGISKIAQHATNLLNYIAAHQKDVSSIVGNLVEITKLFALGVWEGFKATVTTIADVFNDLSGHSAKAKDPLKSVSTFLKEVGKHKKAIVAVGKAFAFYFIGSKTIKGIASLSANVLKFGNTFVSTMKMVGAAAATNPVGAILIGVTALVAGFTLLYKHNKKFRDFCNGIASGAKKAFDDVVKFAKHAWGATTKAFKGIVNFFKKDWKELLLFIANPIVGGFALVYKHNKKFKKFVDGIVKNIKDGFSGAAKWLGKTWNSMKKTWTGAMDTMAKSTKKGFEQTKNYFTGGEKGIKAFTNTAKKLLVISNPVVAGFKLMYEHSKPFKKFVDSTVDHVKDMAKGVAKYMGNLKKDWSEKWDNVKKFASKTWEGIKGNATEAMIALGKDIDKHHKGINKNWFDGWENSKKFLSKKWDEIGALTQEKFGVNITKLITDALTNIGNFFKNTWDNVKKGFGEMWGGMKRLAGDGINAVIALPNAGIDGINKLISDFGGSKEAISKIPKVKFAGGTGMFSSYRNPITKPTLATLNDGYDSPETNHQEMVILPNGKSFLPQGRNVEYLLPAGSEVINASELAMLMGVERGAFAKGTGFWSKIWDTATNVAGSVWDTMKNGVDKFMKMIEFVGDVVKDPVGSLAKKFSPNADKLAGMFNPLGNALYKKPVEEAKNWWKELWSMANASMDEGTVAMGAKGDDYQFKDKAKDAGADPWGYFYRECVSFVASRLANLGVKPSLFSHLGNGNQWVSASVPHLSRPKPGTVAVYTGGPISSNHVDFVTAVHGDTYDGEEYNYGGNGQYHQYAGRHISNAATFLDFGVRDSGGGGEDDSKPLKDRNSPLQTLIKRQVGGMFDWIKKTLGPLLSPAGGGEDGPQGTGVARWRESVVRALEANGIEPNNFRVSKILATIQRESNGDPNVQNNWDSNARAGHPSIGLMQTIGPTFNAYKHPGHNNIRNGYDNLLAAINYIKHTYGTSDAAFNRVAAYGYANGGLVHKNGVYELAEGDMPEYVIPTDIAKRGRAWQLLTEAVARFAGDAPQGNHDSTPNHERVSVLEEKLDVMIGLLGQLVTNGSNPIEIRNVIDGRSVSNGLAPFMTKATNDYERRQALLGGSII
jgi:tape measure domain-containing protein